MRPYLKGRPVSLVRAPSGIGGDLFSSATWMPRCPARVCCRSPCIRGIRPAGAADAEGGAGGSQMNAIEFHTWNAVKTTIDKPDRIVFDLDPGEGVPWENVRQAARVLRALLSEIGLDSWLKTSGGKGLHVLVPLRRQHG